MPKIVVDFDSILYKAAFYGQTSEETELEATDEPLKWVKHRYDYFDGNKAREFVEAFLSPISAAYDEVVLAGSDRSHTYWRHSVLPGYKANRKDSARPPGVVLREQWLPLDITVVPNMEADDVCAVYMTNGYDCYSPDKDLKTVPGVIVNMEYTHSDCDFGTEPPKWRITGTTDVTEYDAFYNFCYQCLVGDSCDGIPGCTGVGAVTAKKLLSRLETKKDMWKAVAKAYEKAGYKCRAPLMQQAQVLRMKRTFDEPLWTPALEGITFG